MIILIPTKIPATITPIAVFWSFSISLIKLKGDILTKIQKVIVYNINPTITYKRDSSKIDKLIIIERYKINKP